MLHKQSVSPPRSSNRTCGFPASGSPTGFTAGMRRASDTSVMSVSVPPWLHDTACSESFRNYAVLYRLAPSHPPSPSSISTPEVRVLSSTGVTQLHRYYDPVRLPLEPMPYGTVEAATLAQHGPPPLARSPVSTCRAHYPGGPVQVRLSAASPDRAAFPELRAGRRPQLPFRGLLRLHSHYRPSSSLARPRRTLSQGFDPADYSTEPPASYRANRPLPGWDLHPQGDRAFRGAPEFRRVEVYWRFDRSACAKRYLTAP